MDATGFACILQNWCNPDRCNLGFSLGFLSIPGPEYRPAPPARHRAERRRQKETRDMPTGTVKWFNTTKGYGFIAPDEGGKDVFVHISAVERSGLTGLADNQKVGFELQEGRDGRQMAGDLTLL
jgi:CspA family cold shock protein